MFPLAEYVEALFLLRLDFGEPLCVNGVLLPLSPC